MNVTEVLQWLTVSLAKWPTKPGQADSGGAAVDVQRLLVSIVPQPCATSRVLDRARLHQRSQLNCIRVASRTPELKLNVDS